MRRVALASLWSFAVYAIPLLTVHTVTLAGVDLAKSWRRGGPDVALTDAPAGAPAVSVYALPPAG